MICDDALMKNRTDRITEHILNAAISIRLSRGSLEDTRTLLERGVPFHTAFRVLHQPHRRRNERRPLIRCE